MERRESHQRHKATVKRRSAGPVSGTAPSQSSDLLRTDAQPMPGVSRSLERGLRILLSFSGERRAWTIPELSDTFDIPLASAYRIVRSLEAAGFIERQGEGRGYGPGLQFIRLAALVLSDLDIREVAKPIMRKLAAQLGETAVLLVPGPGVAVCIDNVEGLSAIRPRSLSIGEHVPYNGGAGPMAIFAFLPAEEQDRIINKGLTHITDSTVVDPAIFRKRCADIVRTRVCRSCNEAIPGTEAVASPIFSGDGSPVAGSIALTGMEGRLEGAEERILEAAAEIGRRLGSYPR